MFPDICRNGLCQNLQKTGYKCICDQGFEYQGISQTTCVGKYINHVHRKYSSAEKFAILAILGG